MILSAIVEKLKRQSLVGGETVVEHGRHRRRPAIETRYHRAIAVLRSGLAL